MRAIATGTALRAGLLLALAGCSGERGEATKEVEQAVGIQKTGEVTTSQQKKEYIREVETKIIEKDSGKVISDKKEDTPVTIETSVKKDVNVKAGDPKVSPPPK